MFKSGFTSTQDDAGRPAVLRAALAEGEDKLIARIVIDKAKSGDSGAARFLLGLLCPRPRGRAIALDLPKGARAGDVVAVFNATLRALAAGEITPDEALTITRVLDGRIRMLKTWQLERQMLRRDAIPGDELFAAHDDAPSAAQTEPSPSGPFDNRSGGQGEGVRRTHDGAALGSAESPHPDPLPGGEGTAEPGAAHLHSACIQPSPATIAGRREAAALALAQVLRDMP
jgi:hypothetical protein